MKLVKIGSLAIACIAIATVAWYRTSAAVAEGHECCGGASSGSSSDMKSNPAPKAEPVSKSEASDKKTGQASIEEQKKSYPLNVCVVLGNKLGEHDEAVDYVYKGRLVRFCCKGCIDSFEKDPAKYLAKLDEAAKGKAKSKAKTGTSDSEGRGTVGEKPSENHSQHR